MPTGLVPHTKGNQKTKADSSIDYFFVSAERSREREWAWVSYRTEWRGGAAEALVSAKMPASSDQLQVVGPRWNSLHERNLH